MIHHTAEITAHLTRGESEDPKAMPFGDAVADRVMLRLRFVRMLVTIDLDDQTEGETGKVEIVASERELPTEGIAAFTQALEAAP